MRPDRLTSYRQKLRRSLDAFEFGALIEGVSTLEEDSPSSFESLAPITILPGAIAAVEPPPPRDMSEADDPPEIGIQTILPLAAHGPQDLRLERPSLDQDRLHSALSDLSARLRTELGCFQALLDAREIEESGTRLSRLNHILELLASIDPNGDISRHLEITGAPPAGRSWPKPAWSLYEFGESPLSGLLPPGCSEELVREVMYAAWGVPVETR